MKKEETTQLDHDIFKHYATIGRTNENTQEEIDQNQYLSGNRSTNPNLKSN